MAKLKTSNSDKLTFGKRKSGQPRGKKSFNKHSPRPKTYQGQGR